LNACGALLTTSNDIVSLVGVRLITWGASTIISLLMVLLVAWVSSPCLSWTNLLVLFV
jgi:hypothetical protein